MKTQRALQSSRCKSHQSQLWVLITILVWRHNSIHAKRVARDVWPSEAACVWEFPLVFNMCVWVQGFSATAWFPSHISRMERQSYYTMESCLHGTAASMFRLGGPGYSLDRPVTKPGAWFMGQLRVGRGSVSSAITPGFDGVFTTSIFRTFELLHKNQLLILWQCCI